jgi:O-antigen/teichoic acid export membrane protein
MKDAFKAVFWGFLGVRKKAEYEADTKRLTPQAVIAAGILCALAFVLVLFGIVKLVTR